MSIEMIPLFGGAVAMATISFMSWRRRWSVEYTTEMTLYTAGMFLFAWMGLRSWLG